MAQFKNKLAHFLGRDRFSDSLNDEIRSHIEMRADELTSGGMARFEATAQAQREFGSEARVAEESRDAWRWTWFEDLARDLRHATRSLSRDRRFAFTAVLSLALGIGVNAMIFSLASSFLLSEPSVRDPESIVRIQIGGRGQVQMRELRFLQDAGVFSAMFGFDENAELNWRSGDTSQRLFGIRVTDNFFAETHVPIALGRSFGKGERDVVVISHRFWQSQLGGDANAVGRMMILDGETYTIAGILAANHRTLIGLGFAPDLYIPVRSDLARISLYGRLPEGASLQQMPQRLTPVCLEMDRVLPDPDVKWARAIQLDPVTGLQRFVGKRKMRVFAQFFLLLMIVVGLLLMIACTNVASLLLARSAGRTREFALRLSVGATRGRLIRQLLAESLLLSLLGAAAGLVLNACLTKALNGMLLPLPVPIRLVLESDWRLLAYSAVIAVASAVLAGLLPALSSTRSTQATLKQDEHQMGGGTKLRKALVAAQLAVSVVVLVTAALFVRNLLQSTTMNPGFDIEHTTWAQMRLTPESFPESAQTFALARKVLERVRGMAGVESASYTNVVPLNDSSNNMGPVSSDTRTDSVSLRYQTFVVSEEFFQTMAIPVTAGREFTVEDRQSGPKVVIVNKSLAKAVFGSVPPVGHTIRFGSEPSTVIGVVADSKYVTLGEDPAPAIFQPYLDQQGNRSNLSFLIRSSVPPSTLTRAFAKELLLLEPNAAVEVKPMNQAMGFALLPSRAGAGLLGSIGILGLTLASIGLFGVLSYSVSRRVREIGLRLALGAKSADILRLVMGEGAWMIGSGLAIGIFVSMFVTRPLTMFLVAGLTPSDPWTYVAVAAVLLAVGFLASVKPAMRALKADPAVTLRFE